MKMCVQGGHVKIVVANLLRIPVICLRKDLYHVGTNAQVSGMRSWHADTSADLSSGSAHVMQTFLNKTRNLKNSSN